MISVLFTQEARGKETEAMQTEIDELPTHTKKQIKTHV